MQELFEILVPKQGSVKDLITGLQKKANIDEETIQDVRIYEAHGSKIHKIFHDEEKISSISEFVALYAEVTPEEEKQLLDGESLISCFHFDKDSNKPHGVPFRLVVKPVRYLNVLLHGSN